MRWVVFTVIVSIAVGAAALARGRATDDQSGRTR